LGDDLNADPSMHGLPCRLENENIKERKKVRERKGKTRRVFSRIALDGKRIVISIDIDGRCGWSSL